MTICSIIQLGTTYVDLYLIHHPSTVPNIPAAWKELEQAKAEGLTKSIGISNATVAQLKELLLDAKVVPAVNQVHRRLDFHPHLSLTSIYWLFSLFQIELHPYNLKQQAEILAFSALHNIVIESYSALTPLTKRPGGPVDKVIAKAAKRLNATPAQVIFLWVKAKGAVIVTCVTPPIHSVSSLPFHLSIIIYE